MHPAVVVALTLLPALAGCFFDHGGVGSGTDCASSIPVEDGFRVKVPPTVGEGRDETTTVGLCVRMAGPDQTSIERRVGEDQMAWFPVAQGGHFGFSLYVTQPQDRYCAHALDGAGDHDGSGIVTVALVHGNVSLCA